MGKAVEGNIKSNRKQNNNKMKAAQLVLGEHRLCRLDMLYMCMVLDYITIHKNKVTNTSDHNEDMEDFVRAEVLMLSVEDREL